MTYEEKVGWLSGYRDTIAEMNDLMSRIVYAKAMAEKVTASLSAAAVSGGGRDRLQGCVENIVELEVHYADLTVKSVNRVIAMEEVIDRVPNARWRNLLRWKYIDGISLNRIADRMEISTKHIGRLHRSAVERVVIRDEERIALSE